MSYDVWINIGELTLKVSSSAAVHLDVYNSRKIARIYNTYLNFKNK